MEAMDETQIDSYQLPRLDEHDQESTCFSTNPMGLMAGLWQETQFARIPLDAPPELEPLVHEIDNPFQVWAIHKASRRHGFQICVDRFIHQLRVGCGDRQCRTATCFSCRKRLAGKAPLRRYNQASARILAVYLASLDNPKAHLCSSLLQTRKSSSAPNNLSFFARPKSPPHPDTKRCHSSKSTKGQGPVPKPATGSTARDRVENNVSASVQGSDHSAKPSQAQPSSARGQTDQPEMVVASHITSRDHRSFAAAAFGTVAFKMLEWLTPHGLESISDKLNQAKEADNAHDEFQSRTNSHDTSTAPSELRPDICSKGVPFNSDSQEQLGVKSSKQTAAKRETGIERKPSSNPASRSERRVSTKSKPRQTSQEDSKSTVVSPVSGGFPDKPLRSLLGNNLSASSPIPEAPIKPVFFENVTSPPKGPSPKPPTHKASSQDRLKVSPKLEGKRRGLVSTKHHQSGTHNAQPPTVKKEHCLSNNGFESYALPQSLSHLNISALMFICQCFAIDGTYEKATRLSSLVRAPAEPQIPITVYSRRTIPDGVSNVSKWKSFNEQTLFRVLGDPAALLASFSEDGQLYDTHTLLYCLTHLMRVSPSLALHSLWIAAGSLLLPPKQLRNLVKPTKQPPESQSPKITGSEGGDVLAICFHSLVALLPLVEDIRSLFDLSRQLSSGSFIGHRDSVTQDQQDLRLAFSDAFTNDLALRLARRLCCGIVARRRYADMAEMSKNVSRTAGNDDILDSLLKQIDLFSTSNVQKLDFPMTSRIMRETRNTTFLLNWAMAVLLHDWDGRPDFSTDSAFSGALSLMNALYEKRPALLIADIQFRVDYISERLDLVHMPLSWVHIPPSRKRGHLLDYPFLFSPETLVSFFRSINFAQMCRSFEESSSLKTRMTAIVEPGSLITNPHHKTVLQDLLRTASSKYLVLDISRKNVLRDAFDQLWRREERELLRPLKVHLGEDSGEQGFDSGGVQQEFFRLAIAECLDPNYGAFTVDERTRMAWFVPSSVVEAWQYELIGTLFSLALYNGLTLPITFPKALYRKLLGEPVSEVRHIADGWPDLANGLRALLDWSEEDGAVEDIFARTYEFSVPLYDSHITLPMDNEESAWPQVPEPAQPSDDSGAPMVTSSNRTGYVRDYIRYLTDVSVQPQFLAFERGFRTCLEAKSLRLLVSPVLQSLVEGEQQIDVAELRRVTKYVGWNASHHTVRDFWSIVKKYDDEMKRKLLEFVTASERVPAGGVKTIQFVIQRNGTEEGQAARLPSSYTCYGTLLLPVYPDKETLRERLAMALQNAQGFGNA